MANAWNRHLQRIGTAKYQYVQEAAGLDRPGKQTHLAAVETFA